MIYECYVVELDFVFLSYRYYLFNYIYLEIINYRLFLITFVNHVMMHTISSTKA